MPKRIPDLALEQLWRSRLDRFRHSGLSVRAYCARERLRETAFYFWRRQIAQRDARRPADPPAFLPVQVVPAAAPPLEVVLPDGHVVRVPPGFDPALLRAVLAALEGAPC